jgi:NAD(P)-dependent dehydrogenase (short-subunit alcohol dehydrogenase family)
VAKGVAEFGRIDFVIANAGILPAAGPQGREISAFLDAVNVMLHGVYYTIEAALPALLSHGDGGAIVITSSAAGFKPVTVDFGTMNHGAAGYTVAKHGVIGVMRHYAMALAEKNIRVNTVHPGGVATPMIYNEAMAGWSAEHPSFSVSQKPLLDVPPVEPEAISDAMVYLCGTSGRYLTGVALPVDGGQIIK